MLSPTIRRLSIAIALAVFAIASLFHPLKPAYACSCVAPRPPLEARDEAQAVFSGTVSSVQSDASGLLVTFDVDEIWKGPEGAQLTLATPGSSASCGYEFAQGERYLVYGFAQEGRLNTGLCTRTAPLASAGEDLAAFGPGTPAPVAPAAPAPEPSVGMPWLPVALGGVAVAAATAVALVALRRRAA